MPRQMSARALRAMFGVESNDDMAGLIKLSGGGLDEPVCLTDNAAERLVVDPDGDEDVAYGLISEGVTHLFVPMTVTLPEDQDDGDGSWQFALHDVTRRVLPVLRQAQGQLDAELRLVLVETPDVVEGVWSGFKFYAFDYDENTVTCRIALPDDSVEPGVADSFTPHNFPGLF